MEYYYIDFLFNAGYKYIIIIKMGNSQSNNTPDNETLYQNYLNQQFIIQQQQQQLNNLYQRQNTPQQQNMSQQQNIPQPVKPKLNPYKILKIGKQYDEGSLKRAYFKAALIAHPDRGGSPGEFQKVSIAYTVLLKHLENQKNNHIHSDLRDHSRDYVETQSSDNMKNPHFDKDHFNTGVFNKIYDENRLDDVYDKGYDNFMKESKVEQPKMFNGKFNKDMFHKEFETYKQKQSKAKGEQMVIHEPKEMISYSNSDSMVSLGIQKVDDFSGSVGGLGYRDLRDAFENPTLIDTSSVDINGRSKNIEGIEESRSNISYKISAKDKSRYDKQKRLEKLKENERIQNVGKQDNIAFDTYNRLHARMIGN